MSLWWWHKSHAEMNREREDESVGRALTVSFSQCEIIKIVCKIISRKLQHTKRLLIL